MNRKAQRLPRVLRTVGAPLIILAVLRIETYFPYVRNTTRTYLILLLILLLAVRWGRSAALAASVVGALGFLYYLQEPTGTFKAADPESYVAVGAFLLTALVVSTSELKAQQRTAEALESKRETEQLYEFGQTMLATDNFQATVWIAINRSLPIFAMTGAAFYIPPSATHRSGEASALVEEKLFDVARSASAYRDTTTGVSVVPVTMGEDLTGAFGLCGAALSETVLNSIGSLLTAVLSRVLVGEKLIVQQQMSESLLLNILPREVADELRTRGMVSPKYFEDVTILFTDFVGFTLSTETMAAEELVAILHDYFTEFDQIVARYHLEKMKTIGDSYMCISGLPVRNPAHPVDMVMAAFEMLHVVEERSRADTGIKWKIRIGIHSGPVVAGVVGIDKFAFDIWGDTVNFSSRMESSGAANRINLSERTHSRVKDFFVCEHRGKVSTKEKREYDMYFANGVLPNLLHGSSENPPAAFARRYFVYFQKTPPSFPRFFIEGTHPTQLEHGGVSPRLLAETAMVTGVAQGSYPQADQAESTT